MSYSYSSNIDSGELVKYSSVWPIEIFALIGQFPQLWPPSVIANCLLREKSEFLFCLIEVAIIDWMQIDWQLPRCLSSAALCTCCHLQSRQVNEAHKVGQGNGALESQESAK